MGYEMYRLLSLKKSFVAGRKKKSKKTMGPVVIDLDEEDRQQELLKGGEGGAEKEPGCVSGSSTIGCHSFVTPSSSRYRESLVPARSGRGDL